MRSATILLALAALVQVQAGICHKIGVYGCIEANTNCALLKGCIHSIGEEQCVDFPESLNDKMTHYMGYLGGVTKAQFYEHYGCQGAILYEPGHMQWTNPNDVGFYSAPWAKQASSVKIQYYKSPY
ncbi:MAG: hypothetical protein J3R72DRAFT_470340 [Linnemannia gamsii]|nr:MAG: hypothetical protein J3R72DRAFT_470340 [Linnemannia gamsii]